MAIAAESGACGSCSWQVEHVDDDHGNEYWQAYGIGRRQDTAEHVVRVHGKLSMWMTTMAS